jgi:hypothetical protein
MDVLLSIHGECLHLSTLPGHKPRIYTTTIMKITTMKIMVRKHHQQVQDRDERPTKRANRRAGQEGNTANPQEPDIANMVCALWMQNARKGQHQVHATKADRNQKKVEGWLESMK